MKKFLVILFLTAAGYSSTARPVEIINEKIVQNFKEIYPNAFR